MPFSWYSPDVPTEYANAAEKAHSMYKLEMGERAALLRRLGFDRDQVIARLKGNLNWDFEMNQIPDDLMDQVEPVVDGVFAHRGLPGGGPPAL